MTGYFFYIGTTETTLVGLATVLDAGMGGLAVGGAPGAVIGAAAGALVYGGYVLYQNLKPDYVSVMKGYKPKEQNAQHTCENYP